VGLLSSGVTFEAARGTTGRGSALRLRQREGSEPTRGRSLGGFTSPLRARGLPLLEAEPPTDCDTTGEGGATKLCAPLCLKKLLDRGDIESGDSELVLMSRWSTIEGCHKGAFFEETRRERG